MAARSTQFTSGADKVRTVGAIPMMTRILNILLPTIFPIAISALPFLAALTDVNNSGRDVMLDAPGPIDQSQFDELHLKVELPE